MFRTGLRSTAVVVGVLLAGFSSSVVSAGDQPGVTAKQITVGSTFPFSGPASSLGNVGKAFMGYIDLINDRGGVDFAPVAAIYRQELGADR